MKRQSVRLITAALTAAGIAACFSDPTSSLRNGPARIQLTRSAAVVPIGDSVQVEARLVDAQGSLLPITGASWTTDNAAVADVQVAATQLPGDGSTRAYIRGIRTLGGITTVRVTARGVSDSVRVTALPTRYLGAGTSTATGTATADTVPGSSPVVAFTAGDTLTITAPAGMTFDTTSSVVTLGGTPTYLLSRSATSIKVLALKGFRGEATVTNVTWIGNATTGDYSLASLNTSDTITIARARFRGAIGLAASAFGPNTQMTLTAGPGTTFNNVTNLSSVFLGLNPATVLSRSPTTITLISAAAYTGVVKVTNVNVGTVRVDSLISPAASTIAPAFFPGTATNGAGRMLDTIVVRGAGAATFTTAAATASQVTVNGAQAWVISRTADSIRVIARQGGSAALSVSNVIVAGTTIPSLSTQNPVSVSTTVTGEANEPGNDAPGATPFSFAGATSANPFVIFGAVDGNGSGLGVDADDFFTFTLAAPATVTIQLQMVGTGGGGASNPDIDLLVCNAACSAFPFGFFGATGANPENHVITNMPAGTYNIYVNGWATGSLTFPYRLSVY